MNPWHVIDGECLKKKFGTEHSATRFRDSHDCTRAQYPYRCSICGCWHLSSAATVVSVNGVRRTPIDLTIIKDTHPEADYWLHKIKCNARYSSRKIPKRNKVAKHKNAME